MNDADNWTICPRCVPSENEALKLAREAEAKYGKIPASEYLALVNKAKEISQSELKYTFREDWHIGVDAEGDFSISYHGQCTACGFTHRFNHGPQKL